MLVNITESTAHSTALDSRPQVGLGASQLRAQGTLVKVRLATTTTFLLEKCCPAHAAAFRCVSKKQKQHEAAAAHCSIWFCCLHQSSNITLEARRVKVGYQLVNWKLEKPWCKDTRDPRKEFCSSREHAVYFCVLMLHKIICKSECRQSVLQ